MPSPHRRRAALGAAIATAIMMLAPTSSIASERDDAARTVTDIEFLGEAVLASGETFDGTEIGGLSSISYDERRNTEFAPGGLDPEGLVLARRGQLYMSSEGNITSNPIIDPFIRRYNLRGQPTGVLPIPDKYIPNGIDFGLRRNLSFESLNLTPDGRQLVTAGEGALYQDGPASSFQNGSLARVLSYDLRRNRPVSEYVYEVCPWAEPSGILGVNGIVEVLPIDNEGTVLAVERSFSVGGALGGGTGNVVSIYEASTAGATNVLSVYALYENGASINLVPMSKRLVFSFDDLGIPIDNIEGMTFSPRLEDGPASLVIVSDNDFSPSQFTQFIVLALDNDGDGDGDSDDDEDEDDDHYSLASLSALITVAASSSVIVSCSDYRRNFPAGPNRRQP